MSRRFYAAAVIALSLGTSAFAQSFPTLELSAGIHRIEVEVAATQRNRMQGLMQRETLAANRGMLFVFPADSRHCMWMRNTLVALSVAFLDGAGKIINVEDMQPRTENNHCAARPARYALEMNLGWFQRHGIGPGDVLSGIEKAPPSD